MKLGIIKGQIGNVLRIAKPPRCLREAILALHRFPNPAYEQAKKYSPWGAPKHIPQYIDLAHEDGDALLFPRGFTGGKLDTTARSFWKCIKWEDCRAEAPAVFPAVKMARSKEQKTLERRKTIPYNRKAP